MAYFKLLGGHVQNKLAYLLLVIIAICNVYFSTQRYGIGLITDSYYYLSMAENIANHAQMVCYEGYYFSLWPPLYPLLLSLPIYVGCTPSQAALLLNYVGYACGLCLAYHCLQPFLRQPIQHFLACIALIGFYPLYSESTYAMTDLLYYACCLWCLQQNFLYKGTKFNIFYLGLATSCACLLRYVGVVWVVVGIGVILVYTPRHTKAILRTISLFLLLALLPLCFWWGYNYFFHNTLYGERVWGNGYDALQNLFTILHYMAFTLLPFQYTMGNFAILVLLLCCVFIGYRTFKNQINISLQSKKIFFIYSFFSILHLTFVWGLSISAAFVPLYIRYLVPVSYWVLLIVFIILNDFFVEIKKVQNPIYQKITIVLGAVIFLIWSSQNLRSTVLHILARNQYGAGGFTTEDFMHCEFQQWLRQKQWTGEVFTNALPLAFLHLHYAHQTASPRLLYTPENTFTTKFVNYPHTRTIMLFKNPEYPQNTILPSNYKLLYSDYKVNVYVATTK